VPNTLETSIKEGCDSNTPCSETLVWIKLK
jgi:hypothetical protein